MFVQEENYTLPPLAFVDVFNRAREGFYTAYSNTILEEGVPHAE